MDRIVVRALAAAACVMASSSAMAADAQFTVYEGGKIIASWMQSLEPTPAFDVLNEGTTVPISDGTGLTTGDTLLDYYNIAYAPYVIGASPTAVGGLYDENLLDISGIQYYTRTEANPLFMIGVYTGGFDAFSGSPATLTITSPVPEPATWAMMLLGLGTIGYGLRRRSNIALSYA